MSKEQSKALAGQVAVITGAASGIGRGIAKAAAEAGMRLVLADVSEKALVAFAAELNATGTEALAIVTDVRDAEALSRLAKRTIEAFGQIRLLFANAGIETLGFSWELSAEQWQRAIGINVLGVINTTRVFLPHMIAAGKSAGVIITGSLGSLSMAAASAPYIMSKHANLSFAECLAIECDHVAPFVRVSVALPGPVASNIFVNADGAQRSGAVSGQREAMHKLIQAGRSSDEAGRVIFDQCLDGRFWITTHPQMLAQFIERRATYLTQRERPAMSPEGKKLIQLPD